jgi:glycosyltransferase involved in cell wall biosynthesis
MRVAVLWTHLSGYLNACLRELAARQGVRLFVAHAAASGVAPFEEGQFAWLDEAYEWRGRPGRVELLERLEAWSPEVTLVSGWNIPAYRWVLRRLKGRCLRLLAMDNQWRGTPRQWLGVLSSPFWVRPLFEGAFVPGERQAEFARRLGFAEGRILRGLLCGDQAGFSAARRAREAGESPRAFIFAGRLSPEKGVATLLEAYRLYRRATAEPWPLICCGVGPWLPALRAEAGVEARGFVQPDDLPRELGRAGCFLLPSLREPWGVALHEAAAAGLALICTSACGASVHLVQDGYNGYLVEAGSPGGLCRAMLRYTRLGAAEREAMGRRSAELAAQFTPARWAAHLLQRSAEMQAEAACGGRAIRRGAGR